MNRYITSGTPTGFRFCIGDRVSVAPTEIWGGHGIVGYDTRFNCFVVISEKNDGHWALNQFCNKDISLIK